MKCQITIKKGAFGISDYWRARLNDYVTKNGEQRGILELILPESKKLRGYLMGGLLPLAVYLDGGDYKDKDERDLYFDMYKEEYTPEYRTVKFKGKEINRLTGASSKGREALKRITEKLLEHLYEQHSIEYGAKVTSPEEFKKFRDEIYPHELQYEDWIDYCKKLNLIK